MADESNHSRTEAPTPRRREEARKKGQVAYSADLSNGILLSAGVLVLWIGGSRLAGVALETMHANLRNIGSSELEPAELSRLAWSTIGQFIRLTGLVAGCLFLAALFIGFAQAGFRFTLNPLRPDWNRVSLTRGWSKLMSQRSAARGIWSFVKLMVIVAAAAWVAANFDREIALSGGGSLLFASSQAWTIAMKAGMTVALSMLVIGLIDYLFQRWKHEQDLHMSRRDIQDEQRREEGDPHTRNRQKQLRRQAAQQRMMREVPDASVVVTNPTHVAVALKYERGKMNAPSVVAKGQDHLAKRIIKLARESGIPVIERKPLARALYKAVKIGQEIPAEFYHAIAEIMAFVLGLRRSV